MKTNEILLQLIGNNASVNEICSITGLSPKQLFYRLNMLKIKGYDFEKKYYYNGDIVYSIINSLTKKNKNEATIITSPKDTEFRAVLISDLHLGNVNDRPDLLYEVYNFCAKEGINIIINAGDLIDGAIGCGNVHNKKISDVNKQIEYFLNNYPYDKNILNFICLGNHDYSSLTSTGIDLEKILENKRHDLVSIGYQYCVINVKNDAIIVRHFVETEERQRKSLANRLNIIGHSHRNKNVVRSSQVNMWIPSLSDMSTGDIKGYNKQYPSIIVADISFRNGWFDIGVFEHFIFVNNEIIKVSESQYELISGKNVMQETIINEEERKPLSKKEIDNILGITNNDLKKENAKSLRLTQTE